MKVKYYHAIPIIFGIIHDLSSHGKTSTIKRKWRKVEDKLLRHYSSKLYKMINLGIIKERI